MNLIEVKNAIKTYQTGEDSFNALNDVSLTIKKGEFTAIMGICSELLTNLHPEAISLTEKIC